MGLDNDDEDANNLATHHELLKNRMATQNNIVNKRREQLKAWEKSEMNKLPAIRKPPSTSHVKFQDSDIFFSACVSGDEDELDDLLDKGANVNTSTIDGVTALHQAVIDNKFEMVRFLVNRGAQINAQDNEGWTPLHASVCCGNITIVKFLCDKGADITMANSDKELPVDLAEDDEIKAYLEAKLAAKGLSAEECRGNEERQIMKDCMDWIRAGNYLDKPHPRTGATALHVAASKGYNKLISLLIQAGADVNAADFELWTPLHAAAHFGEKDACRILLSRGADVGKRTITGQDVIQVADSSVVDYLEQASPSSNTSSSISSIQTRSRSITPEEASSSSLYSSDQSVAFTLKIPNGTTATQQNATNNSSSATQSSTGSGEKQQVSSSNNTANSSSSNKNAAPAPTLQLKPEPVVPKDPPPPVPPKSTTPLARLASPSSESSLVSESSSSATMSSRRPNKNETPKTSNAISNTPTMSTTQASIRRLNEHLTTPTIASATRQRHAMVRSASVQNSPAPLSTPIKPSANAVPRDTPTSNPPWVSHWKSPQGTIQIGNKSSAQQQQQRTSSAASSTSSTANESMASATSTPATSPAPGYFKPSIMQAIQLRPTTQIRSWQTPPQQPTPQKESEAERKAKSRLQRASRRSTQGVTLDQLNEARSAANSPTVNSSSTNNSTDTTNSTKNDDIGKWKSSALQQQTSKSSRETSTSESTSNTGTSTASTTNSTSTSLKPTVTGSTSSMSKQSNVPTMPVETPSAARMQRRRSELQKNRRGPSPDSEMSISSSTTGRDLKQTSSSQQLEDGTKSPTAIVQPMQSSPSTPTPPRDSMQKPYFVAPRITLQDRVNEIANQSISDDNFKPPPVIPRTLPPGSLPKSDSFQNGITNMKDATFGSTADLHYKALYEKTLVENDLLRKQVDELKYPSGKKEPVDPQLTNGSSTFITVRKNNTASSNGSQSSTASTGNSTHLDESDRRGYERKIVELEYELQKARQLQSDHKRLKDENNALIRVISKLSKDYPSARQGINSSTSLSASSTGAQTKSSTASSVSK